MTDLFSGIASGPSQFCKTCHDDIKIPIELRKLDQWVVWRLEDRGGKPDKVLYQARSPKFHAKSNDRTTWAGYEEANRALSDKSNHLAGLGFVVTPDDPYLGVDLDNCRNPADGTLAAWVYPITNHLASYTEVTPSKTGIRIWIKARLEGTGRKKSKVGIDQQGSIEVYDRGRFFTITGEPLGNVREIVDRSEVFARLFAQWFPIEKKERVKPEGPARDDDQSIIAKLRSDKNGPKFIRLFDQGETTGFDANGGQNEADLALCSMIAFRAQGDPEIVDRIFRMSSLYRPKWDEGRGDKTYGRMTVERACERSTFHDPNYRDPANAKPDQIKSVADKSANDPIRFHAEERPTILITTEEHNVNDQAVAALARDDDLFCRGPYLVTVQCDLKESKIVRRQPNTPRIAELKKWALREKLTKNAVWIAKKWDAKEDDWIEVLAHPPEWSAPMILERGNWPMIRGLEGITESPTLLPDGSVLDRPGYDPGSGLYYKPNYDFPPIPGTITRDDARRAAETILSVIADFPFAWIGEDGGIGHRAAYLAGLLTPLARYAIDGPCPLFLADANVPGAGKSKLCDIVSIILCGRKAARTTYPDNNEEMKKQIIAIAIEGDRMVLIDNIPSGSAIGGAALDAVLTGTTVKGRILGKSEMTPEIPIYTVWYATGNNLRLKGDALRRVVPYRLESPKEHPEERNDFAITGDLLKYVAAHRGTLFVAAMMILRGHILAGSPQSDLLPMDYGEWCGVVRQAIHWAIGVDPCGTRHEMVAEDPETNLLRVFLTGWASLPRGSVGISISEAYGHLKNPDKRDQFTGLRAALSEWSRDGELPTAKSLGMRLTAIKGRIIDGKVMRSKPTSDGQVYRVEDAGEKDAILSAHETDRSDVREIEPSEISGTY